METMRLGRNDVCRCGSGKKYKKCCLNYQGARPAPTFRAPPRPGGVPTIPLGDSGLEAFEHKDVVFVKDKGWTHERHLMPGDQYRLKGGGWETVMPERVIGTTHEHPFYSQERGWTPAGELRPGELIRTEDGWVPVKSIVDPIFETKDRRIVATPSPALPSVPPGTPRPGSDTPATGAVAPRCRTRSTPSAPAPTPAPTRTPTGKRPRT